MVANAGLDNEKSALTYQVELLKDQLEECEEQSALVTKELREKSRDFELLKRSHAETQRAVQLLQVKQKNYIVIKITSMHFSRVSRIFCMLHFLAICRIISIRACSYQYLFTTD